MRTWLYLVIADDLGPQLSGGDDAQPAACLEAFLALDWKDADSALSRKFEFEFTCAHGQGSIVYNFGRHRHFVS